MIFRRWAHGRDWLALLIIVAVSMIVARPLFMTGLVYHDDAYSALVRAVGLVHVWQDGQVVGRWLPDINFGYGYPLHNFYAPLLSYCVAGIYFLVHDFAIAMNVVLILGILLSGVAMYFFARELWGKSGALLSAIAYLLVPFHACEIYRRSANAESLTFVFIPLILWRFHRLLLMPGALSFIWAALAVAGLVLCHNVMTMLFLPVAAAYVVFLLIVDPRDIGRKMLLCAGVIAGALALTAYFWLPAMIEKQYVMINKIYDGNWDYHHHFMTLKQFFVAPWTCGSISYTNGVSFQLGNGHFLLGGAALVAVLWRRSPRLVQHFLFWLLMGMWLTFLVLKDSVGLWEAVPLAKYVQYPWRIFVILSFVISLLAGGVVLFLRGTGRWLLLAACALMLVWANFSFAVIDRTRSIGIKDPQAFLFNSRPMDNMEYLPKTVRAIPMAPPLKRYEILQGDGVITYQKKISGVQHELVVEGKTPLVVCFHHFYFPGWKVVVDGRYVDIHTDNPYGMIMFVVSPGTHAIQIRFGHTPIRWVGEILSLLTLAALAFLVGLRGWQRRRWPLKQCQ